MIKRTVAEIANMAGGRVVYGDPAQQVVGVSTDTRVDLTGKLFVPLIGEKFDAHQFLEQAVQQGAVAALWQADHPLPDTSIALIEVEDTLRGLQQLSTSYRQQLKVRVVGVTGSNGKTSTKDMIASVLAERFRVQKTQGNMNNHIGLPLMMLSLTDETEVAVLEMGMNHRHEIERLAELAHPEIAVITNVGEAHIEYLGSRGGIADAKCELIEALPATGKAILFGDEPLLRERAGKTTAEIVWFGFQAGNDLQAVEVESLGMQGSRFSVRGEETCYELSIPGNHQVGNALAAVAVGRALGMSPAEIAAGLAKATLTARRFEQKPARLGGTVIDDAYNAGPTSMRPALQMLADLPGGYKVAVLGDMLELGPDAPKFHYEIGAFLAPLAIDRLVCVGELAQHVAAGARENGFAADAIFSTTERQQAIGFLQALLQQHADDAAGGAILLVKASQGMQFKEIVQALT